MTAKLHMTCNTLPLSLFIRCLVDEDLTALVIEGDADMQTLTNAWQAINQEWMDLCGNKQNNYLLVLALEIERMSFSQEVTVCAVDALRMCRFDDLVKVLHEQGYRFPFNPSNPEEYHNDLNRVLARSKRHLVDIQDKKQQYERLKGGGTGKKVDHQYFNQMLVILSKFIGYHIDEERTTVARYATVANMYYQHIEQLEKKSNGRQKDR